MFQSEDREGFENFSTIFYQELLHKRFKIVKDLRVSQPNSFMLFLNRIIRHYTCNSVMSLLRVIYIYLYVYIN